MPARPASVARPLGQDGTGRDDTGRLRVGGLGWGRLASPRLAPRCGPAGLMGSSWLSRAAEETRAEGRGGERRM